MSPKKKLQHIRWKPEMFKKYWFIPDIDATFWYGDHEDKTRQVNGNCFKTKKEAMSKLREIKEMLKEQKRTGQSLASIARLALVDRYQKKR